MWAYCVDAVGRYIGPITVSVHFVRKGWTLANRSIMIMCCSNSILGTIMQFSTEWCSLHIEKSKIFAVSALIFIVEDAYILRNLPYHDYILGKFDFGHDQAILYRFMRLGLRIKFNFLKFLFIFFANISIISSLYSFSSHIFKKGRGISVLQTSLLLIALCTKDMYILTTPKMIFAGFFYDCCT